VKVLYHQDSRFGRATLEEEPDGKLLFTVSGPGKGARGVAFVLDDSEAALFRSWGSRFLDVLANRARRNPAEYAHRDLLPPFDPAAAEAEEERAREARRAAASRRTAVAAALAAATALLVLVAWALDRPDVPGELRRGQALSVHGAPAEEQLRHYLVVALDGGGDVSVPVPADHALRQGAPVLLREYRSRLFGKTGYRFERYQ
jgi:hypothetical protein